jgi:hypothetical protein
MRPIIRDIQIRVVNVQTVEAKNGFIKQKQSNKKDERQRNPKAIARNRCRDFLGKPNNHYKGAKKSNV